MLMLRHSVVVTYKINIFWINLRNKECLLYYTIVFYPFSQNLLVCLWVRVKVCDVRLKLKGSLAIFPSIKRTSIFLWKGRKRLNWGRSRIYLRGPNLASKTVQLPPKNCLFPFLPGRISLQSNRRPYCKCQGWVWRQSLWFCSKSSAKSGPKSAILG